MSSDCMQILFLLDQLTVSQLQHSVCDGGVVVDSVYGKCGWGGCV